MTKSKQHATHPKEAVRPPAQSADSRLDEALEESFPASDPIAVDMSEPRHPAVDEVPSAGKKRQEVLGFSFAGRVFWWGAWGFGLSLFC